MSKASRELSLPIVASIGIVAKNDIPRAVKSKNKIFVYKIPYRRARTVQPLGRCVREQKYLAYKQNMY